MQNWVIDVWCWAKTNDLPNWAVVAFTVFIWPLALLWISRRSVNNVPNLEISPSQGSQNIGTPQAATQFPAVVLDFKNRTGSVVYISGMRIKPRPKTFQVPAAASRDIATGMHELKFLDAAGTTFGLNEITLQTGETARTSIAVTTQLPPEFYSYNPPWYRRRVRCPKYFTLKYTAMVGDTRRVVSTVY
jgi:hypothetical protein